MAIQRTDSKFQAPPLQATPAQAPKSGAASKPEAMREARGAVSGADSYRGARAPEAGARPQRPDARAEQGVSLQEQRRASRAAQADRSAGGSPPASGQHDVLERIGHAIGFGAGVVVTEALALLPGANEALLGKDGKPVQSVPGAERIGEHDILKRHQEVIGPKITELTKKLPSGGLHDLLEGIGAGATEAPGASYRLEAELQDSLHDLWKKLTGGK